MFQIYDCQGRAVGRPQGYARHHIAQALVTRPGRIRRDVYDAFAQARAANPEHTRVYKITYQDQAK